MQVQSSLIHPLSLHMYSWYHFHPILYFGSLVKNGLTALEIAEVKAEEDKSQYYDTLEDRPNYERVISLLREHSEEPSSLPSYPVSCMSIYLGNVTALSGTYTAGNIIVLICK